jgi:hypothetical protein
MTNTAESSFFVDFDWKLNISGWNGVWSRLFSSESLKPHWRWEIGNELRRDNECELEIDREAGF